MERKECAILVEGLSKRYGDLEAVKEISFCVKRGEIFGFLGPNGAGKTTTVRMLCGLTRIGGGKAWIEGYDVEKDLKKVKSLIGVVPDSSNLYWELTCEENLIFCGEMQGVPSRERKKRAEELLRFFGLWERKEDKFKALSKGLKRRLTIAASLIHRPKVLFMDEPTSGLDVFSKRSLWERILELRRERNVTIFLTTHNVREAFEICDRIAIINRGKIMATGKPWELRKELSASGVVEVLLKPRPDLKEVEEIPGVVRAEARRDLIKAYTSDLLATIEGMAKYARTHGLELYMMNAGGADAEEVFVKMVRGEGVGSEKGILHS